MSLTTTKGLCIGYIRMTIKMLRKSLLIWCFTYVHEYVTFLYPNISYRISIHPLNLRILRIFKCSLWQFVEFDRYILQTLLCVCMWLEKITENSGWAFKFLFLISFFRLIIDLCCCVVWLLYIQNIHLHA